MTATLIVLFAVVLVFGVLEGLWAHRQRPDSAHLRADLLFVGCDFLGHVLASVLRLGLPVGVAWLARGHYEGPMASLPVWAQVGLGSLVLEFGIWAMHWAWHRFDALYPFHETHHAIEHVYFLSGLRQHPVQFLGDQMAFALLLTLCGLSPEAVGFVALVQLVAACFTHSNLNVKMPGPLKYLIASPRFHVLHHDRTGAHAYKNLGGALSCFDYLFGTAVDPDDVPEPVALGDGAEDPREVLASLVAPFKRKPQPKESQPDEPQPSQPQESAQESTQPERETVAA